MAFDRPTLQVLIDRVEGDIKSGLDLVTLLRRSFLKVMARVLAGIAHLLFGFLKFIEKQAFPDTAEAEYLEQWSAIWGITRKAATFAEFTCSVTGLAGTPIPVNSIYRRTDGSEYTSQASVTLTGSGDTIDLVASKAGQASEVAVNDIISILSPIAGLDSNATVTVITTEPEDTEVDESLRARLVARIQTPPAGGAAHDYLAWALAVAGITRAWVGPQALGPGTVTVWCVSDDEDPITPSPAKITEVFDYIEARRPVTATLSVAAPILDPMTLTIQLKPNTAEVQTQVENELADMILRDGSLAGSYKAPGELYDGKILLSRVNEAISIAIGEVDHIVTLINGVTPADVEPIDGHLVTLGAITWQTLA